VNHEPDYDNTNIVRMAIVEKDDRLVILMPTDTPQEYVESFVENYKAYGWPADRIMVMKGPEAFAVLKPSEDEGQGDEKKSEGDQVDFGPEGATEGGDAETDDGQDPEQKIDSESHTIVHTPEESCSHGLKWIGMSYSHFAIYHKTDHP
jgi:hypothetical protein